MKTKKVDRRFKNKHLDSKGTPKHERLLELMIVFMARKYVGHKDVVSGEWVYKGVSLKDYPNGGAKFFTDERYEVLYFIWKTHVQNKYGKEMNTLGMSAVMQNQMRKAFRNGELNPLLNQNNKIHQSVVENIVCKFLEVSQVNSEDKDLKNLVHTELTTKKAA